jgi:hypothetical protein
MGPGSVSAFTRVFDALWAGTTKIGGTPSSQVYVSAFLRIT